MLDFYCGAALAAFIVFPLIRFWSLAFLCSRSTRFQLSFTHGLRCSQWSPLSLSLFGVAQARQQRRQRQSRASATRRGVCRITARLSVTSMAMTAFGPVQQSNNSMRQQHRLGQSCQLLSQWSFGFGFEWRCPLRRCRRVILEPPSFYNATIALVEFQTQCELLLAATKLIRATGYG